MTRCIPPRYSCGMDHTTNHLATCRGISPHILEDYLLGWPEEARTESVVQGFQRQSQDGTFRYELAFEYAVKNRINAEHTSGKGSDLIFNGRIFFHKLELKTTTASIQNNGRNRATFDFSEAKADADHLVGIIYSIEADQCFFIVKPLADHKDAAGKFRGSLNIEFTKQGYPSKDSKSIDCFYETYDDMIAAVQKLS